MAHQAYEINLINLVQQFGSEEQCREYLEKLRWPDGIVCPKCASAKISRLHKRNQFHCDGCTHQFSVTAGTIMHDTKIPLWKWFLAVYMMVESKKGVSANQLRRTLKVTYRTAWFLCHRIRKALETPEGVLRGIVEMDATYIGGRAPGQGNKTNKTLIIGAIERGGDVRITAEPEQGGGESKARLGKFIRANIGADAMVYTDEHNAYPGLLAAHVRGHQTIRHREGEWVKGGGIHTNSIEGAWGLFKRSVVGAYHQLSCKHLDAYLDEFEFRFNNRKNPYIFRDAMRLVVQGQAMEYKALVA